MQICNELSVVAGDDLTLAVSLAYENGEGVLMGEEEATADLIIHCGSEDETYRATAYEDGVAKFVLCGNETARLLANNPSGCFCYCIRVNFKDGTQNTPIHRQLLTIERC